MGLDALGRPERVDGKDGNQATITCTQAYSNVLKVHSNVLKVYSNVLKVHSNVLIGEQEAIDLSKLTTRAVRATLTK